VAGRPETDAGRGEAGVLGLPEGVIAGLFDLDGVLTNTAGVHDKAWTEMFDAFLRERAEQTGGSFVAFDPSADYSLYVDGKPRPDGVRDFLASRGIRLPEGSPDGTGPDSLHNADVRQRFWRSSSRSRYVEAPDDQVFGLAVTLPGLI
jgi:hypothetical protein